LPAKRRLSQTSSYLRLKIVGFQAVQGKWKVTIDTPMGEKTGVLELLVSGETLTGSLSNDAHRVAISEGKIDGERLSWQAKIDKPMRLNIKFTAVVDGDRISGTARHLLGSAKFSGRKV
jgi:hypothetical protein